MNRITRKKILPILIVSTKLDVATDAVCGILSRQETPFWRWNTEDYPYYKEITLSPNKGNSHCGIALNEMGNAWRSLWYRRVRSPETPPFWENPSIPSLHEYCARESHAFVVGSCLAFNGPTMSRPASIFSAEHKLYQLRIAKEVGLIFPRTTVTNCPEEVQAAYRRFRGKMICKPLRSGYVPMKSGEGLSVFTSQVLDEHLAQAEQARLCPSIYQELIPKSSDIRVTIVGTEVFAVRIHSQDDDDAKIDWRRTKRKNLPLEPVKLSNELIKKLIAFVRRLDLVFAAIDLVEDEKGNMVFLEVNPNGQWVWLDDILNLGISESVAKWLISGGKNV